MEKNEVKIIVVLASWATVGGFGTVLYLSRNSEAFGIPSEGWSAISLGMVILASVLVVVFMGRLLVESVLERRSLKHKPSLETSLPELSADSEAPKANNGRRIHSLAIRFNDDHWAMIHPVAEWTSLNCRVGLELLNMTVHPRTVVDAHLIWKKGDEVLRDVPYEGVYLLNRDGIKNPDFRLEVKDISAAFVLNFEEMIPLDMFVPVVSASTFVLRLYVTGEEYPIEKDIFSMRMHAWDYPAKEAWVGESDW